MEKNPKEKEKWAGTIFKRYEQHGGEAVAVFEDPETNKDFSLTREELEDKIENLKKDGELFETEEKALKGWPRSIDKILI